MLRRALRRPLLVAAALVLAAGVPAPARLLPNDLVARGKNGAVSSAEPHATAAGLAVLRDGGNAVDAAVAVALVLAVTHPQAGNLGGGGFLLVRMLDGRTGAFDFRERAPASATAAMYLKPDGTVDEDKILTGATAAGVPGSPAGLCRALEKFGTRSLKDLAAPAIRLAREGFPVDHFLAADLRDEAKLLGRFPSTRAVFFRDDHTLAQGDVLVQPDLAVTLERLAAEGPKGFYEGATAALIAEQMQRDGGFVTAQDLKAYAPMEREVLRGKYRGREVLTMPPPSSGGVALLQMLQLLEPFDLRGMGFGGSRSIHLLTEVMRRAYADRSRWLGDPDHYRVPVTGMLAKDYLDRLRQGIRSDRVSEVAPGQPAGAEADHTTHFSVVDKDGNAVSCTTTINSSFGSGLVVQGAGFFLNNEMDDFSAKPGVPNQFGLVGAKANAIAPGKRMLSSMTPTIVLGPEGHLELVLGSPGGGRIITTVLQVLLNVYDHGMGIESAVRAPRVHHQWKPEQLTWESLALSPDVRAALAAMGHTFTDKPRAIGQCMAIQVTGKGERIAVCDHRSSGAAAAY